MFGFVKNMQTWIGPKPNPIGVDFGSDCLRLAQVGLVDGEHRIVAAACTDVPPHIRENPSLRPAFFIDSVRDLLSQANFRGRETILGLPASTMYIQHLRLPKLDADGIKKAIPWEARGKLPIDPSQALIRHLVAGEIYSDQESKCEVIVMAAARKDVNDLLAAAGKARLDVVGMNVEPSAIIDCFTHIYRRKTDEDVVNCFVDIGSSGTRAVIACSGKMLFARNIGIGGDHFSRAVAESLGIGLDDAKMLRIKLCHIQAGEPAREKQALTATETTQSEQSFALLSAGLDAQRRKTAAAGADEADNQSRVATAVIEEEQPAAVEDDFADLIAPPPGTRAQHVNPADMARRVDQATRDTLIKLVEELDMCRRYYETTFAGQPVQRLIFVGGEARQRAMCQHVAKELSLAAQVGDPLVRMGRLSDIGPESGLDRRQPQPGWATAIGLSMGPKEQKEVKD